MSEPSPVQRGLQRTSQQESPVKYLRCLYAVGVISINSSNPFTCLFSFLRLTKHPDPELQRKERRCPQKVCWEQLLQMSLVLICCRVGGEKKIKRKFYILCRKSR